MCPLSQFSCYTLLTVMQWPPLTGTLVPHEGKSGNRSVKRQSLSELLSTLPIDWQRFTHPRLIFLRSQCFIRAATMSWDNEYECVCVSLSRRGLLAYVYNGVSLTTTALVAGMALIYYGSVALTFTVRQ